MTTATRDGVPLRVLIADPDDDTAMALARELESHPAVLDVQRERSLDGVLARLSDRRFNALYIDPIGLGLERASDVVFEARERHPTVVFVLYCNFAEREEVRDVFYAGERKRWHHYFALDKLTPAGEFPAAVDTSVNQCQGDLAYDLTQQEISSLQGELEAIRSSASTDSAEMPVDLLQEVLRQLEEAQRRTENERRDRPASFLGPGADAVDDSRCFVVMPYSEPWSAEVETIVEETCEQLGIEFTIAREMDGRYVPADIWRGVTGAGIVVADLTNANPNVTYEVGLADAIGRTVILLCQQDVVPFDFLAQRLLLYRNEIGGDQELRRELTKRLQAVSSEG